MSHPPVFSMQVPASMLVTGQAPHHFHIVLPVTNNGATAVHVTASTLSRTLLAREHPVAASAVSFGRESFTIRPGHTYKEQVTFTLPASYTGRKVANVQFVAQPMGTGIHIRPAVATAVHFRLSGPTTWAHAGVIPSVGPRVPVSSGGFPTAVAGIGLAVLAVIVLAVLVARRRRTRHA